MKKLGILHLSDLHINKESISVLDQLVEKLINDIEIVKQENNVEINLVCFAGDLIGRGDMAFEGEMQIEIAEKHFIHPLLKSLKLTNRDFIIVPGNHEVDIRKISKATEKGLSGMESVKDINDIVSNMEDEYKKRIQYFYQYIQKNYIDDADIWELGYSIERSINGLKIGIAGIDSAWRSTGAGSIERGRMIVGEQQVTVLYDKIKNADFKICLMHHPIDWLIDLEMNNVEKKLNQFDLVLRGHVHDLDDKQISTQRYKTIYNTSGKLYPLDNYYSGYSIISIDMNINQCRLFSREYLPAPREEFDKALRINKEGKTEYNLISYDSEKMTENDLKYQLKKYFEDSSEKFSMLKSYNSASPNKVGDFFVEPTMYKRSKNNKTEILEQDDEVKNFISIKDLILNKENVMMISKREGGKTTLLQQIGLKHSNIESEHIPVYIDILNISKSKERILTACYHFLFDNLSDSVHIKKEHILSFLKKGKLILLVDNFNVSDSDHIKWLRNFIKEFPKNRFIFTCEENFYQSNNMRKLPELGIEYIPIYLEFFGKRQVREMVTKWGNGKHDFDPNEMTNKIFTYCKNINFSMTPFNIAVFMTIWDVDRSFIPINEGKVMSTYLETVLDKLSIEGFQRSKYGFGEKQHFLGYLANEMYSKDKYYLLLNDFFRIVDEYHDKHAFDKNLSRFDKMFFEKNILYTSGDYVFFSNTSVLEYCLASYAIVNSKLYDYIASNKTSYVRELSFYSGIAPDCTLLLDCLNIEITEIILKNIDLLDEMEEITFKNGFKTDKSSFQKLISENRLSISELDEMNEDISQITNAQSPIELKKKNTVNESESFFNLLLLYGNVIKNAETASKVQKKLHLETYILSMNFLFGFVMKKLSAYLSGKSKEELPDDLKNNHVSLTDEAFEVEKEMTIDFLKIVLPISMQTHIAANIGTPKLNIVINELIRANSTKKFTKFMLTFLYCDIGNGNIEQFLLNYIKNEESKDILTLILIKLTFYYRTRYFGNDFQTDCSLLDLIAEVQYKLNSSDNLQEKAQKDRIKQIIKQDTKNRRREKVG